MTKRARTSQYAEPLRAAAYLRKSQKAKRKGKESQESSIERQRELYDRYCVRHPVALADDCEFIDAGVRGWKRGEERLGWRNMLAAAQEGRFTVVLVENIDRFSRATVGEVYQDVLKLRAAGVTKIIETGEGGTTYDLGEDEEIGAIIRFVVAVWSANEFSRKLSLRISETRRKKAVEGVRSAGPAPYGYENDGEGGLVLGDRAKVAIVQQIFQEFTEGKPMAGIARELNERGIKGPRGGLWAKDSVKTLLRQRAYLGEFRYGDYPQGKFHRLNEEGEIVRADDAAAGKVIVVVNKHDAIVDRDTFEGAARRLERIESEGRREKGNTHLLSGILRCGKCGAKMHKACRTSGGDVLYRCGKYIRFGFAGCDSHSIAEANILPYIIDLATAELAKLEASFAPSDPPEEIAAPWKVRARKLENLQAERDDVSAKLDAAVENCLFADAELRQRADKVLARLRKQLATLDAEIEALREQAGEIGFIVDQGELERLAEYQRRLQETMLDVKTEGGKLTCDRRKLRALLDEMGCRVDLFFQSRDVVCKSGRKMRKHTFFKGRFRLGLREEEFIADKTSACRSRRRRRGHTARRAPPLDTCSPRRRPPRPLPDPRRRSRTSHSLGAARRPGVRLLSANPSPHRTRRPAPETDGDS